MTDNLIPIEYYEAASGELVSPGIETIYQPGIHTAGLASNSWILLTTTSGYVDSLRNKNFAIITTFNIYDTSDTGAMVFDTQTIHIEADVQGIYLRKVAGGPAIKVKWSSGVGTSFLITGTQSEVVCGELHFHLIFGNFATTNGGSLNIDGEFRKIATPYSGVLNTADPTRIRLGARLDDPTSVADDSCVADFGFFAILDLDNIIGDFNISWTDAFASMMYTLMQDYNYNPSRIRKEIYTYDKGIKGVYWKLDEAGESGDASNLTLSAYDIRTGKLKSGFGGSTSATGCTGVRL